MSVPPNPKNMPWLWIGWFQTKWTDGVGADRARSDAIDLGRLIVLTEEPPSIFRARRLGFRFYIHKDLIDDA